MSEKIWSGVGTENEEWSEMFFFVVHTVVFEGTKKWGVKKICWGAIF